MTKKELKEMENKVCKCSCDFMNLLSSYQVVSYKDLEYGTYLEKDIMRDYDDYKRIKDVFDEFLNIDTYQLIWDVQELLSTYKVDSIRELIKMKEGKEDERQD